MPTCRIIHPNPVYILELNAFELDTLIQALSNKRLDSDEATVCHQILRVLIETAE